MDHNLALELVRVTEAAALAAYTQVGLGDKQQADKAAVEAIRKTLPSVLGRNGLQGHIVLGEGVIDEAPRLDAGETFGHEGRILDIVVDPLEGTDLAASGSPGAISAIAACLRDEGWFAQLPEGYMLKIAVPHPAREVVDIRESIEWNLHGIAQALGKSLEQLTVLMLNRPRHKMFVEQIRSIGARIQFIQDGDILGAIEPAEEGSRVDVLYGVGKSTEAVLAAAALRCFDGEIQCRWWIDPESEQAPSFTRQSRPSAELHPHGLYPDVVYTTEDLAQGNISFALTTVTPTTVLGGVEMTKAGAMTHSIAARSKSGTVRYLTTYHRFLAHQGVPAPVY